MVIYLFLFLKLLEIVCVQFNQTEKEHKVRITSLSREDGQPVTISALMKGKELPLDYNKKSYGWSNSSGNCWDK